MLLIQMARLIGNNADGPSMEIKRMNDHGLHSPTLPVCPAAPPALRWCPKVLASKADQWTESMRQDNSTPTQFVFQPAPPT